MSDCEIAVVGGGLVGASAALSLALAGREVTLIEATEAPRREAEWDERCIGLNAASVELLEGLGVWSEVRPEAAPILGTHVSEAGRFGVARFHARDAGLPALGYNTPLRAIHQALLAAAASRVRVLAPTTVAALRQDEDGVELSLEGEGGPRLRARLVVACDGADSPTRARVGLGADRHDYGQVATVSTLRCERDHQGIAWERFLPGGPLAVLPRGDRLCTVVWTRPAAEALADESDPQWLAQVQAAFGRRLGGLHDLGRRMRWPLARVYSHGVVAGRVVLAGNAAQTLHPVVAQGFNLGLRDCAALAATVGRGGDPGDAGALADYAALRAEDRASVATMTDRLVRLFSNRLPLLSSTRHLGLLGLDLWPTMHRDVMMQSLGLPALARIRAAAGSAS